MGYYLPETASGQPNLTAKNRVWGFFGESVSVCLETRPPALETHQKNYDVSRKAASGIPLWISRDPIGEGGGLNLYGFVGNNPVDNFDYLGKNLFRRTGGTRWAFVTLKFSCVAKAETNSLLASCCSNKEMTASGSSSYHYQFNEVGVGDMIAGNDAGITEAKDSRIINDAIAKADAKARAKCAKNKICTELWQGDSNQRLENW